MTSDLFNSDGYQDRQKWDLARGPRCTTDLKSYE